MHFLNVFSNYSPIQKQANTINMLFLRLFILAVLSALRGTFLASMIIRRTN